MQTLGIVIAISMSACTRITPTKTPVKATPPGTVVNSASKLAQGTVSVGSVSGKWKSDCIQTSSQSFWVQTITFLGTGYFSETHHYSDNQCKTDLWKEERISTYTFNPLTSGDVILTETLVALRYTAFDANSAKVWNQSQFCQVNNWKVNQAVTFSSPGVCNVQTPKLYIEIYGNQELHLKTTPSGIATAYILQP